MKKLKKFLKLSDPYPNYWYEITCYLKTILGTLALIGGVLVMFQSSLILGTGLILLGGFLFGRIKLIQKLLKSLR